MERYAFIDVANTKGTTRGVLDFGIDWLKLLQLLKGERWQCREVFYYEGAMDTPKYRKRHDKLSKMGYAVKSKIIFLHKNEERTVKFQCEKCRHENSALFQEAKFLCTKCTSLESPVIAYTKNHAKANFDVELTVDALDYARPGTEILLFTGDGDFRYLAEKLIERGAMVTFVSSTHKTLESKRRFSTRLGGLITLEEARARDVGEKSRVRFQEIDNWRRLIKKSQNEENAAKRDVSE